MKNLILYPMFFYIVYVFCLIILNLKTRMKAVKAGEVSPNYFKTYAEKNNLPHRIAVLERHVDNQFQLPPIFLITCTLLISLELVNYLAIAFAWLFVFSRLAHSYVHLGSNKVMRRAKIYALGWLIIFAMWIHLLLNSF